MPFGQIATHIHQISVFVLLSWRKLPRFLHAKICSLCSLGSKCTGYSFIYFWDKKLILTDQTLKPHTKLFSWTSQYFSFYREYFQNISLCSMSYICILDCTFGVVGCTFPFYTDLHSWHDIKCFSAPSVSSVSASHSLCLELHSS